MKPVYEAWRNPENRDLGQPAAGLPRALRIRALRYENARTRTFELDGALGAAPGQFVMVWLPEIGERPFSLAGDDPVRLTIAAVGPLSRALHAMNRGDRVWVRGPLGQGYRLPTQRSHALLIGGGYGVAPLRFLARRLLAGGHAVSMIIGARTADDLLPAEEADQPGLTLWTTTEDGSAGQHGLVIDAVAPALAAAGDLKTSVFACGPNGMLRAVAALCAAQRLPCQLSWEAPMRCGIGLCGSCELGDGWLACLDGPVLNFDPFEVAP